MKEKLETIIEEINILLMEIDNIQVQSLHNSYIWDNDDLKEEIVNIRYLVEEIDI